MGEDGAVCFNANGGGGEKSGRTHGNGPERTVNEHESRGTRRHEDLVFNAEFVAKILKGRGAAEALRSQFEEEATASDGIDDATGARRGFDELRVNAELAQGISADEAGDAAADHQCWDVTGHRAVSILAGSESL